MEMASAVEMHVVWYSLGPGSRCLAGGAAHLDIFVLVWLDLDHQRALTGDTGSHFCRGLYVWRGFAGSSPFWRGSGEGPKFLDAKPRPLDSSTRTRLWFRATSPTASLSGLPLLRYNIANPRPLHQSCGVAVSIC